MTIEKTVYLKPAILNKNNFIIVDKNENLISVIKKNKKGFSINGFQYENLIDAFFKFVDANFYSFSIKNLNEVFSDE